MVAKFAMVSLAIAADGRLSARDMRLYVALCGYRDRAGECWPSQMTLARDTNIDRRKIPDLLRKLEGFGLIKRQRRKHEHGGWARTKYTIIFPESEAPSVGTDVPLPGDISVPMRGGKVSPPEGPSGVTAGGALTDQSKNRPCKQLSRESKASADPRIDSIDRASKSQPATRLSGDAILSDEWRDIAERRRPDLDPAKVYDKFKRYWTSPDARNPTKKDWTTAWINWLEREHASTRDRTEKRNATGDRFQAAINGARAVLSK